MPTRRWIVSAAQQRSIDEAAVRLGTPASALMMSAGTHAAEWILEQRRPQSAIVLAGPGGNGGDAFVVAQRLKQRGVSIRVFAWCELSACAPLAREMGLRLQDSGAEVPRLEGSHSALEEAIRHADLIIDGLFGSGLSRPLNALGADIVARVNRSGVPIVSLDVPSGLPSDAGEILGPAVQADTTLAMAFYKPCHWLYPAAAHCGSVLQVDVDYPPAAMDEVLPMARVTDRSEISALLPYRRPWGHKGTFGHVMAIVGSYGMAGAAVLCARGALRAGAGRITLVIPESIAPVVQAAVPEALTLPLPDPSGRLADPELANDLATSLAEADALVVGPGLSRDSGTLELVRRLLRLPLAPWVVDADAIYALVGDDALCTSLAGRAVLTPHPGEFAALIGSTSDRVDRERLERVRAFSSRPSPTLILKGRPTVIGRGKGDLVINPTGNTGLATGGSGDVLAGLLAGLIAGGSTIADAAVLAPYVHGSVADAWASECSERSMTPSDLIAALPHRLKELET